MDSDQPPSYNSFSGHSPDADSPPAYVSNEQRASPSQPPIGEECPTLVLDGCSIFPRLNQNRILYIISNPPCEASAAIYGVEKVRYRASEGDGGTRFRSRRDHIYDFKGDYFSIGMRDISIVGKGSSKRVFKNVTMTRGFGTSSFNVAGHFKTEQSVKNRVQNGSEITWKDANGKVIAAETRVERDREGKIVEPPRLEIKSILDENELDLLVTCWCARLWKQGKSELSETWEQIKGVKRRIGNHSRVGGGVYG